jgi:2,3-bisphosphoglycerate-independent phosphoglycerate mutase
MNPPYGLVVCDGFGCRRERDANAVALAHTPAFDRLRARFPFAEILSHGESVGLMPGLMGNSEVGHMNLGAGRIVVQAIDRINRAAAEGALGKNPAIAGVFAAAQPAGKRLHLLGLVSDGGVHSLDAHYFALLDAAAAAGLKGDRVVFHVFADGRDVPPSSAHKYLAALRRKMEATGVGVVGTVSGRYYAMDRDKRWERLEKAYACLVRGEGPRAATAEAAIDAAYARGETDEFVAPTVVGDVPPIAPGDAAFFFNFRSDRARQLTEALTGFDGFSAFPTRPLGLSFATMTDYRAEYPFPTAFPAISLREVTGEVLENAGLRQLRIAETEKYAHVTFFFNGGRENAFRGEDRILVPSPKVATYDLQPEMSAVEVTDRLVEKIRSGAVDFFVCNFANPDMVGHTGILPAAIRAIECVDACIGRISDAVLERGGGMIVTADHGNCEMMIDPATGEPHTAHTVNPVPLHVISERRRGAILSGGGRLCDVMPTLFDLMGLAQSPLMGGVSLLR